MKILPKFALFFLLLSSTMSAAVQERQSLQNQMITDINSVKGIFDSYYAPMGWKISSQNWDIEAEAYKAQGIIKSKSDMSVKEYQRLLRKFLSTSRDYHVTVKFESTEAASLPFSIKGSDGRYFIVDIDRPRLSLSSYPFMVGDELVAFDGKPVQAAIDEIKNATFSEPYTNTDQALAEMILTFRAASKGDKVPQGPITVTVIHQMTGQERSYQMIWDYIPEKIKDINSKKAQVAVRAAVKNISRVLTSDNPFFRKMLSPQEELFSARGTKKVDNNHDIGARESFIPPLGQLVWRTDATSPFYGYLFLTPSDHIVGYVRISSYHGDEEDSAQFADLMGFMQAETDALVIDQVNNPGGSLFYLYTLASTLTDKPLTTPKHRISLCQKDISFLHKLLPMLELVENDEDALAVLGQNSFDGMPVNYQFSTFLLNNMRFLNDQWAAGNNLTDPTYVYGVDHINPSPIANYTKPILLLINELDFSGGDFFPAIMQDNKRAVLLGTTTAGAGGMVDKTSYMNILGIETISLTASIAERTDKNPIENLGVTPDIEYKLTADDLQYGYEGYVQAILSALEGLLQK